MPQGDLPARCSNVGYLTPSTYHLTMGSNRWRMSEVNMPKPKPDSDRRGSLRLDTMFPVQVESLAMGRDLDCVARNISRGGMMLQSRRIIPLGSPVEIRFTLPGGLMGGIRARGEVKNHYYLNYGDPDNPNRMYGMGVRFISFSDDGLERLDHSITSMAAKATATVH